MPILAAMVYWVIIALWLIALSTVAYAYLRNPRTFGAMRLLLIVLAIDTSRNILENFYFGLYFGAQFGVFSNVLIDVLGRPGLLILPKLLNVVAACVVLGLLFWRWLPMAMRERALAERSVRETSDALIQEIEEHRRLFETSGDLIIVTDQNRIVTRISDSCKCLLGYEPSEILGRYGGEFMRSPDMELVRDRLALVRQGERLADFRTSLVHKSGAAIPVSLTAVWSEQAKRFFLIGRDVAERELADKKLRQLAHLDQLTGLPNRTSLLRHLGALATLTVEAGARGVSIALFDLDGFKDINDTLGHAAGDRLLIEVANRLNAVAQPAGQLYRLGGDEFLLIAPNCRDPLSIAKTVTSLLRSLEQRFEIANRSLFVAASAGIAIATGAQFDADQLIADADLALYDAKAAGGGRYSLFVPAMRATAQARQEIDAELRRACAEREFVLHFQPQIRMSDGAIVGAEALLRWRHPQKGLLAPAAFMDALVQSPIALEVGRWILLTACEVSARWRTRGLTPVRMGVNLFPAQFHDGNLVDDVQAALRDTGLPADALELEITENIALGNDDVPLTSLRALRAFGVGIAFDDFGTGFASLSYLMRYPLTRLKIDRSFVQKISENTTLGGAAIVRSVIVMGHNLGFALTAEGVENSDQALFLKNQQCDEAQGFLYSKPISADGFEALLRQNQSSTVPAQLPA